MPNQKRPPLILLHGAWHGAWCWDGNFKEFFENEGFDVRCPDLPSHGKRRGQSPMWRNRIGTYVQDMQILIESLHQPPILIGHSMGGFITQHLMGLGMRFAGVGLLATIPPYGSWRASLTSLQQTPGQFLRTSLNPSLQQNTVEAAQQFLGLNANEKQLTHLAKNMEGASYLAFMDTLFLNLPKAPTQKVSTCVVGGELDHLFPPTSQQATARHYGGLCHIVPNAPHNLMMSDQWKTAAQHFLNWIHTL